MQYTSEQMEKDGVIETARRMCVAARTAPKARGIDNIVTLVLDGEDKAELSAKMREIASRDGRSFLNRDAQNVDTAQAVALIGIKRGTRGLNCGMCGFDTCARMAEKSACVCAFDSIDLGIAIGSAVSIAADDRVDNRVMYSIGLAAAEMNYTQGEQVIWHGIPLSASGKSPFFDRK